MGAAEGLSHQDYGGDEHVSAYRREDGNDYLFELVFHLILLIGMDI
jgi:hypothetical protein